MKRRYPKKSIIVICGPTGIGKTSTAIQLAAQFNGEIISADSMQIYQYMDIGTAKPTLEEQACIKHHLIDIIPPNENFDAARFAQMAHAKIKELEQHEMLPFIVGGTGLYIKALLHGLFRTQPTDPTLLSQLKTDAETYGSRSLHSRLQHVDPAAAQKIHPNDTFRVIRALEIFQRTGIPLSTHQTGHGFKKSMFNALKIGLYLDRELLYERINRRVERMVQEGLLNEVHVLLERGYSKEIKAMQSIGYRHMLQYIDGTLSWDDAVDIMKRDTRRYAKRQFTWFNADPEIKWVDIGDLATITRLITTFFET